MEPGANLEQRSNLAIDSFAPAHLIPSGCLAADFRAHARDPPLRLLRDPRKNLEPSRFARPIPPDDPENLTPLDLERNILQRVDPVRRRSLRSNEWRVTGGGRRSARNAIRIYSNILKGGLKFS